MPTEAGHLLQIIARVERGAEIDRVEAFDPGVRTPLAHTGP
jgi:hypothetical protein